MTHTSPTYCVVHHDWLRFRSREADALEAIEFIRIHGEESGEVERAPLRILILTGEYKGTERWGGIPDITPILRAWDSNAQTEWDLQPCTTPIKIGNVEVSRQHLQDELSPPLSVRADEIRE